jgi:hypothetical protein
MLKIILFIIFSLAIDTSFVHATCSPAEQTVVSRPGRDGPDCWADQDDHSSCIEYLNNYKGFLGCGVAKCITVPPNNTAANPQVTVKVKQCALGFCHTDSGTIQVNQCFKVFWYRFCARLTPHDDAPRPVYKNWPDTPKLGNKCDSKNPNIPYPLRICVFEDSMDAGDTDGDYSPYHHLQPKESLTMTDKALGALATALSYTPLGVIINGILPNSISSLFKFLTTPNQIVESNIGCIDIPLAPGPPPFCPTLNYFSTAETVRLCNPGEVPTPANVCAVGEIVSSSTNVFQDKYIFNTFFKPSARVGFHRLLPICQTSADKDCVSFQGDLTLSDAFYIKSCSNAGKNEPCAKPNLQKVALPAKYNTDPFRKFYHIQSTTDSSIVAEGQWADVSSTQYKAKLVGIDIGDYEDVNLSYNTPSSDIAVGTSSSSNSPFSVNEFTADGSQIKNSDKFEICSDIATTTNALSPETKINMLSSSNTALQALSLPRLPSPKPIVAKCGQEICGQTYNCDSTHTDPKIVACLGESQLDGTYKNCQCGILSKNTSTYYLHGQEFDSLITDDNYASWLTEYPDPKPAVYNSNKEYVSGIEFDDNKVYKRGGTKICLLGYADPSNKVISKLKALIDQNGQAVKSYPDDNINSLLTYPSFDPVDKIDFNKASGNLKINPKYFESGDSIIPYPGRNSNINLTTLDPTRETLRSMTALEENLCIPIPQPSNCPSEITTEYQWQEALPGTTQTGSCNSGYSTANGQLPQRLCIPLNDSSAGGQVVNPCVKND